MNGGLLHQRGSATRLSEQRRPGRRLGRGGLVLGPKGVYAQTADGPYDPASGQFGETVIAVSLKKRPSRGLVHSSELGISQ